MGDLRGQIRAIAQGPQGFGALLQTDELEHWHYRLPKFQLTQRLGLTSKKNWPVEALVGIDGWGQTAAIGPGETPESPLRLVHTGSAGPFTLAAGAPLGAPVCSFGHVAVPLETATGKLIQVVNLKMQSEVARIELEGARGFAMSITTDEKLVVRSDPGHVLVLDLVRDEVVHDLALS